jgi:hypothetical protein
MEVDVAASVSVSVDLSLFVWRFRNSLLAPGILLAALVLGYRPNG